VSSTQEALVAATVIVHEGDDMSQQCIAGRSKPGSSCFSAAASRCIAGVQPYAVVDCLVNTVVTWLTPLTRIGAGHLHTSTYLLPGCSRSTQCAQVHSPYQQQSVAACGAFFAGVVALQALGPSTHSRLCTRKQATPATPLPRPVACLSTELPHSQPCAGQGHPPATCGVEHHNASTPNATTCNMATRGYCRC
jgi:hypothetical protein